MYSCGGKKRGILLPTKERKDVRTQDGAGKAGGVQWDEKSSEGGSHPEHHAGAGDQGPDHPPACGPEGKKHRHWPHEGSHNKQPDIHAIADPNV